ncbi:unnamed protein product [Microthlaspi erraticum]|uniref:Uncharacterized protein n=1 Tax=Microthlaspi erraticum TaxID=1685480 RepID=A0A6D2IIE7_9BRAS|nr:unnamed protein product [Microthlaspi erraticum]
MAMQAGVGLSRILLLAGAGGVNEAAGSNQFIGGSCSEANYFDWKLCCNLQASLVSSLPQFMREYTGKVDELIKDKIEAQKEQDDKEVMCNSLIALCFLYRHVSFSTLHHAKDKGDYGEGFVG